MIPCATCIHDLSKHFHNSDLAPKMLNSQRYFPLKLQVHCTNSSSTFFVWDTFMYIICFHVSRYPVVQGLPYFGPLKTELSIIVNKLLLLCLVWICQAKILLAFGDSRAKMKGAMFTCLFVVLLLDLPLVTIIILHCLMFSKHKINKLSLFYIHTNRNKGSKWVAWDTV